MKTRLIPFDVEKAKQGAKIVTRDGHSVRIGFYDVKHEYFPILGVVQKGTYETPYGFKKDGKFTEDEDSPYDLFIEEEVETRRMTNQELAWWLRDCPDEHREWKFDTGSSVYSEIDYSEENEHKPVSNNIVIRKNGGGWQEPLIEL